MFVIKHAESELLQHKRNWACKWVRCVNPLRFPPQCGHQHPKIEYQEVQLLPKTWLLKFQPTHGDIWVRRKFKGFSAVRTCSEKQHLPTTFGENPRAMLQRGVPGWVRVLNV